jgi:anthranilate phosphoribosyltransferase
MTGRAGPSHNPRPEKSRSRPKPTVKTAPCLQTSPPVAAEGNVARMLEPLTAVVRSGAELTHEQVTAAVEFLTREDLGADLKADFLCALAERNETPGEIAAFARELRDLAVTPPIDQETRDRGIMDVCGTGGDHQNTFNISTTVALILASAGVPVAKHGNRAITSKSGSADVLEALGVPVDLSPQEAADALREHNFAFFFAPRFHPLFRHLAHARKLCADRGRRTIFNFLGPLLNPARPAMQLVGVSVPALCAPLGRVLQELGLRRAMVVCGRAPTGYLDELSTVGDTVIAEFHHERGFSVSSLAVRDLPVQPTVIGDLSGGDREVNAAVIRRLLAGQERGPKRDAVLLNAGAALFVAGKARSILEGWDLAAELLDSGRAAAKLAQVQR